MALQLKDDTINPAGIRPELLIALLVIREVYDEFGAQCVITSLNDAKHSATSLHYAGAAIDVRTRHVEDRTAQIIRNQIALRLNRHYDIILERDHLHVEYQPRKP